MYNQLMHFINF